MADLSPLKRAILELRELRARLESAERARTEPIAITGTRAPHKTSIRTAMRCRRVPTTMKMGT
jgi:hypothetical protein